MYNYIVQHYKENICIKSTKKLIKNKWSCWKELCTVSKLTHHDTDHKGGNCGQQAGTSFVLRREGEIIDPIYPPPVNSTWMQVHQFWSHTCTKMECSSFDSEVCRFRGSASKFKPTLLLCFWIIYHYFVEKAGAGKKDGKATGKKNMSKPPLRECDCQWWWGES